jgi:purine-cytosine permease-like protein
MEVDNKADASAGRSEPTQNTAQAEPVQREGFHLVTEYEQTPVPSRALLGFKSFVGMYAGEHTAGTELMIGPLFVAAGVSAFDMIVGLLVGNALAVLSWTFFCAPIATRMRLTLYYQAEKICGRHLVTIYNLANGIMFTILAGAMITVAATAAGVGFGFSMPGLNDWLPNSTGWVIAVLIIGALISVVAAGGYRQVSKVANIAAPWMVLMFIIFGIVALRQFIDASGMKISSPKDIWTLANTVIWKGGAPFPGRTKFTFWHVMFFAWFCNMAWHIGMSDLSVFRYARKSWYGIASATGMYLGHFLAWIAAAMLYSVQLYQINLQPSELQALAQAGLLEKFQSHEMVLTADTIRQLIEQGVWTQPPAVLPGPMTFASVGLAGLVCVLMASWTTANPTIYRSGLAFQAIIPKSSRFWVTLVIGMVATVTGMFPAVAMKLLDFVAIWGLILMPMGAIIFIDFWLIQKFGLKSNYAEATRKNFNIAAGLAWFITEGFCLWLVLTGRIEIYFVSLPGWFMTAALYVCLSFFYQKKVRPTSDGGIDQ